MSRIWKIGRFSFLLPYIVVPIAGLFLFKEEDFFTLIVVSILLPFGIESPIIIVYPVCWILTILSFIFCFNDSKKINDRRGKIFNLVFMIALIVTSVLHIAAIVLFVRAFYIPF